MTYEYVLKMDQHKYEYGRNQYCGLDVMVTVRAETFDEASEEAMRILPAPRTDYKWSAFLKSVTLIPEPPGTAFTDQQTEPLTARIARRIPRYRGV